jgi:hypothetical protein
MSSRHVGRGLALTGALGIVALGVHLAPGRGARADTGAGQGATPQPVLGTADSSTVLMGAATAGAPGEAWAYKVLPQDVPPPADASGNDAFAATPAAGSAQGQLVFERASDEDSNWTIAETPLDEAGRPYRGMQPNRLSARITPHGGGLLVGEDQTRPSGKQAVVLVRNPGGRFQVLPEPTTGTLLAAGEGGDPDAEVLAEAGGSGAVADAAVEDSTRPGNTEAFFGALGRAQDGAVVHWNGAKWSREPIELPKGYEGSFTILALDGSSSQNVWMLGQASTQSGLGVMLFKRTETAGEAKWLPVELGSALFSASATPAQSVSGVAPLSGQSQPLTVSDQGVWIDGNLQAPGGGSDGYDFTLYYDLAQGKVTSSWCDAQSAGGEALCSHPLDARFGRLAGYRSFAFDGPGFGSRIITNPLQPGGDDQTNMGAYLSLEGTTFQRLAGAGADNAPGGAFYSPEDGWLEGPVQITGRAVIQRLASWPVSARAPFTAVAPAPRSAPGDPGAQALAVGADGVVARYTPGQGWQREFLLTGSGAVSSPTLRAVAWPEPSRAYAVGDLGAMWLWRAETGLWEKDPAAPPTGFQGDLDGIAFDPQNPALGYAVGQSGALLGYGKTWAQEALPQGFQEANFTSVAFAGAEAMVVAGSDLLINSGSGWQVDPEVHALLASLQSGAGGGQLNVVAGLPNGGAVIAGRDVVIERDSAGAPWHFSAQPIVDETAVAASAYLEGASVRAVLSVVPDFQYPPLLVLPPVEPNTPPPLIPANPLPGDGYLLRETAGGWEDEERAAYAGDSEDKPVKTDPILALDLGTDGAGWAVGGWSGEADDSGRGTTAKGSGQTIRENVETAGIYSYAPQGGPQGPPGTVAAPVALTPGVASFAVAGHAECAAPCADLAAEGIAPDRNLSSALSTIDGLAGEPNGPRALLYTGGRETPGDGPESASEADRYAQLLAQGGGVGVFGAVSAGDSEGASASAFGAAFVAFPAPFGEGSLPAGISTANIPAGAPARPGARTHYAFDSTGPQGTVRVVVIDNSRGSLAASDPYQNPAEPQAPWLAQMLADARARGIPALVMGSRELNPNLPPALNVASDAGEEAQIMVQGGASAYLYERPEESRTSQIPSGAASAIPEYGTGTLGYRSSISDSFTPGQPDALFGTTGYLLVSVNVAARNPATNVAPTSARLIPLVQSLSLDPLDGTLLRRSAPALFQGLGRRPVAGDRWGAVSASSGNPNPPGADPYSQFPPTLCLQSDCASAIEPEYTFTSSEPEVANFVEQDPNSANLRKPLQNASGQVIPDPKSGILCAFNAGTTTVTISAGGLSYSTQVTVLGGSVEQPCGTVPLSASHFAHAAAVPTPPAPAPPPPAPAPAPAPIAPPPAPPVLAPVPAPPVKAAVKPPLPPPVLLFTPLFQLPVQSPVPTVPPPPAAGFGQPIPPGGATVRVFEEKKEEEEATEQSQAFASYRPESYRGLPVAARAYAGRGGGGLGSPALYLLLAAVLAAGAGVSIAGDPRNRGRRTEVELAVATARTQAARAEYPPRRQRRRT